MNVDLEMLAEKAGLYFPLPDGKSYPAALTAEETQQAVEKFAALLIKECANICVNTHPKDLPFLGGILMRKYGIR